MTVFAYVGTPSVPQGGSLPVHVATESGLGTIGVSIYRYGDNTQVLGQRRVGVPAAQASEQAEPYRYGCGWPVLHEQQIGADWPSGLYRLHLDSSAGEGSTDVPFVVTAREPGATSRMLLHLPTTTYQAYSNYGGKSLYYPDLESRASRVSFHRPFSQLAYEFEIPFVEWLYRDGITVECCTSLDLHIAADLLSHYDLFISAGHDEYWSKEMRDHVEEFVRGGGNAAFFSGNTCWWQVRFEDEIRDGPRVVGYRTMVCHKDAESDELYGVDNGRVTVNWREFPVLRPENRLTGVSYAHGGGWYQGSKEEPTGYTVRDSSHWVFAGTGLADGDEFGVAADIVAYEVDGAEYYDDGGVLRARASDGSPLSFRVLATADLSGWAVGGWSAGFVGTTGQGTMGVFRNGGTVFTAATILWGYSGLAKGDASVIQITRNVLDRLSTRPVEPVPGDIEGMSPRASDLKWERIGHAPPMVAMAGSEKKLYAVLRDNRIVSRDPVGWDVAWEDTGRADGVVAMAATAGTLYIATQHNRLFARNPGGADNEWQDIGHTAGHATGVTAMAAIEGKLFAIDRTGVLWWRDQVLREVDWLRIGRAGVLSTMTATNHRLYTVTADRLWWREPVVEDVNWHESVPAANVVAMAALRGKLFNATIDGQFWQRDAVG